ncbi:Mor transcription activator family protein [Variovorax paradoxus]|uniref:Mor transcription activator family protein n=1 Tax=Variovorax paradoxus TaxID=34073 RepID=UPI003D653E8A
MNNGVTDSERTYSADARAIRRCSGTTGTRHHEHRTRRDWHAQSNGGNVFPRSCAGLRRQLSGQDVNIPTSDNTERHATIRRAFSGGNIDDIVRRFKLTWRRAYQIIGRAWTGAAQDDYCKGDGYEGHLTPGAAICSIEWRHGDPARHIHYPARDSRSRWRLACRRAR